MFIIIFQKSGISFHSSALILMLLLLYPLFGKKSRLFLNFLTFFHFCIIINIINFRKVVALMKDDFSQLDSLADRLSKSNEREVGELGRISKVVIPNKPAASTVKTRSVTDLKVTKPYGNYPDMVKSFYGFPYKKVTRR